jgi:hypothetical protein
MLVEFSAMAQTPQDEMRKIDQHKINELAAKKLDLFVKVRELHTEITKVNKELLLSGADYNAVDSCW